MTWLEAAELLSKLNRDEPPPIPGETEVDVWWRSSDETVDAEAWGRFTDAAACVIVQAGAAEHEFSGSEAQRLRFCGRVGSPR